MKRKQDEHVIKMWTPFTLNIDGKYKFIRKGIVHRFLSMALKSVAAIIVSVAAKIFLGFKIDGQKNAKLIKKSGAVTISNHAHIIDCTLVGCCFPSRPVYYISLQSNFEIPVVRHLIRLLNAVPIPDEQAYMENFFEAITNELNKGSLVHIYPEAVLIPRYNGLRNFKKGAFTFAYNSQAPVVPMVIYFKKPYGIYKFFHKKPLVRISVLSPEYPDKNLSKSESINDLKERCYKKMQEEYFSKTDI